VRRRCIALDRGAVSSSSVAAVVGFVSVAGAAHVVVNLALLQWVQQLQQLLREAALDPGEIALSTEVGEISGGQSSDTDGDQSTVPSSWTSLGYPSK
jgi:hypothetical protein